MSKLTARLSDGQEVELVPEAYCDKGQMYLVRPLNYKPSPPKEVWVRIGNCGGVFNSYDKGELKYAHEFPDSKLVRYILAPEPEKKGAREWWDIRSVKSGYIAHSGLSERLCKEIKLEDFPEAEFEIVHVREVVNE